MCPVLPDTPFPGLVEFDGAAIATAVVRRGRRAAWPTAARSTPSASPTSGPRPWCGTGPPASRSVPASDGRTCAPSAPASSSRPRASGWPPTPRPPSWPPSSTRSTPTGPEPSGASWPSAPSTPGWPGCCPDGQLHVTDASNAGVTGLLHGDGAGLERATCWTRCASRPPSCPPSSTRQAIIGTASTLDRRPPIAGMAGDQQASLIGQSCTRPGQAKATFGTGGMLDQCIGADRPPQAVRGPAGTIPIIAWRRRGRVTWGLEAIMLSAGTCVEWLRDDLGIIDDAADSADGRRRLRRHRRRVVRPRPPRSRHTGVGLRRPRHAHRTHPGQRTARSGAGRARGCGPPGGRPPGGGRVRLRSAHRMPCVSTAA